MEELMENNWSKKNVVVFVILAYSLGFLGGHQFYLGNHKAGFIRFGLAVSVIGLPVSVLLLIKDLIQLMRNKIADSEGNIVWVMGFWERWQTVKDVYRKERKETRLLVEMDTKEKADKVNEMKERIRQKEGKRVKSDDLLDDI